MKQEYKLDKHSGEYVLVSIDSSNPTIRLGTRRSYRGVGTVFYKNQFRFGRV